MAKDKKITEENEDFYRLGFINGEGQLKAQIALFKKVNGMLFDELARLDRSDPKVGVLLSYKKIETIIRNLKRAKCNWLVIELRKLKHESQERNDGAAFLDLEEIRRQIT